MINLNSKNEEDLEFKEDFIRKEILKKIY